MMSLQGYLLILATAATVSHGLDSIVPAGVASHSHIIQAVEYMRAAEGKPVHEVILATKEQQPGTHGFWVKSEVVRQSADFEILKVRGRVANDLFVLGHKDGATLIEHWKITAPDHALIAKRPIAKTVIGTAYPGDVVTECVVQGGGEWIAPDERPARDCVMTRELLLSHEPSNPIRSLEVDPDGRFLLFADKTGVVQFNLAADPKAAAVTILPWQCLDDRAQQVDRLLVLQSSVHGRVYIGTVNGSKFAVDYYLVLIDSENDGVFEKVLELPYAEYHPAFPMSEWEKSF